MTCEIDNCAIYNYWKLTQDLNALQPIADSVGNFSLEPSNSSHVVDLILDLDPIWDGRHKSSWREDGAEKYNEAVLANDFHVVFKDVGPIADEAIVSECLILANCIFWSYFFSLLLYFILFDRTLFFQRSILIYHLPESIMELHELPLGLKNWQNVFQ